MALKAGGVQAQMAKVRTIYILISADFDSGRDSQVHFTLLERVKLSFRQIQFVCYALSDT